MPASDLLFRIRAYLHDAVAPGDLAYRGDEHPISLLQEVLDELPDLLDEAERESVAQENRISELAGALEDTREQMEDARGAAIESRRIADLVLKRLNDIRRTITDDFAPEELTGAHRHLAEILALTEPSP